jgi:fructose-bisphosphate aldolase, class II
VLKECQDAVVKAHGDEARFYLVFHGGSGSALSEIHEALDYGVVKMNVDTDMSMRSPVLSPATCSKTTTAY